MNHSFAQKNYGLILFIFGGILIVPELYYLSNIKDFSHDLLLLLFPIMAAVLFFALGLVFHFGEKIQSLLAGFGLSILLCDQFLRLNIRHLDGASKEISIEPVMAIINASVYFGLPILFFIYRKKLKKPLIDLSFIFILLGGVMTLYSAFLSLSHSADVKEMVSSPVSDKKMPNIYFIWLDAMETDYMAEYFKNNRAVQQEFNGFTFFKNNSANYLYTLQSNPSFMSGTLFDGEDYPEWQSRSDWLRRGLSDAGYHITGYAKKKYLSPLDNTSYSSDEVHRQWSGVKHPFVTDFISYWFVRVLPSFHANDSLRIGKEMGGNISSWFNTESPYSQVKSITDGIEPLTGMFTLKQLTIDEPYRESNNEFVIMQAIIPHGPYVIDKNCEYRGKAPKRLPSEIYYEQVECTVGLVQKFFQKLKELKRYDSSIIIVMGDHGAGWAGLIEGFKDGNEALNKEYSPWSKSMVLSRASALLMIKPADNKTKLSISQKETQLIDIYPTIFSLLGRSEISNVEIDGVNVFSDAILNREKYITYFKPAKKIDPYNAKIYDIEFSPMQGLTDVVYRSELKGDKDLPAVNCEQIIDFSSNSDGARFYSEEGLSGTEKWGRWSDGEKVILKFNFQGKGCEPSKIKLHLRSFVAKQHPKQSAKVLLNGVGISTIEVRAGEDIPRDFILAITNSDLKEGELNMLEFQIDSPISPKQIGLHNDSRLLGFGFETIVFQ